MFQLQRPHGDKLLVANRDKMACRSIVLASYSWINQSYGTHRRFSAYSAPCRGALSRPEEPASRAARSLSLLVALSGDSI
jgi:hypothetical protein